MKKISCGDWLNFSGVIIGIVASFFLAYCTFDAQNKATNNLENKLKFSEIVTDLHTNVRSCKDSFRNISENIEKVGFDQYNNVIAGVLFNCRSKLVPFISGLKVFKEGDFGHNEYKYVKGLDSRIDGLIQKVNAMDEKLDVSQYQLINNDVFSISTSEDQNLETLDGLERLLVGE